MPAPVSPPWIAPVAAPSGDPLAHPLPVGGNEHQAADPMTSQRFRVSVGELAALVHASGAGRFYEWRENDLLVGRALLSLRQSASVESNQVGS